MTFRAYFYKGTRPELLAGAFNRAVRLIDDGKYSHMEIEFSDGWSFSSSFMDGGVRKKRISYDLSRWDYIDLPEEWEESVRWKAEARILRGTHYDVAGIFWQAISFPRQHDDKDSCSEFCFSILGMEQEAWRITPNGGHAILRWILL